MKPLICLLFLASLCWGQSEVSITNTNYSGVECKELIGPTTTKESPIILFTSRKNLIDESLFFAKPWADNGYRVVCPLIEGGLAASLEKLTLVINGLHTKDARIGVAGYKSNSIYARILTGAEKGPFNLCHRDSRIKCVLVIVPGGPLLSKAVWKDSKASYMALRITEGDNSPVDFSLAFWEQCLKDNPVSREWLQLRGQTRRYQNETFTQPKP
jgi:hypothetical protein